MENVHCLNRMHEKCLIYPQDTHNKNRISLDYLECMQFYECVIFYMFSVFVFLYVE